MKALFAALTLLSAATSFAQTAPVPAAPKAGVKVDTKAAPGAAQSAFAPPPGQPTGNAPPVSSSGFREDNDSWRDRRDNDENRRDNDENRRDNDDFWRDRHGTPVVLEREDMDQRLARLQELVSDALARSRDGKARGKLNKAQEELNDIRQAVANAPDMRDFRRRPAPPPPAPPPPAYQPIADAMLQRLLGSMSREHFAENKMTILQDAAGSNYFLVGQVQQMLSQFQFSRDRLQVVRLLWPRVLDRQNGFELYGSFQFSDEKAQLKEIISG
ncbi:MAG: DUF4476 domain-containing protein [Archangium sp.]